VPSRAVATWLAALVCATSPVSGQAPCDDAFRVLQGAPHVSLERRSGSFESVWPGEPRAICEVTFVTNDSTLAAASAPSLEAAPGTVMHELEWRAIPEIMADGPGTSVFGIRKGSTRCIVEWEQPAYLDDDGDIVQSGTVTIVVRCSTT